MLTTHFFKKNVFLTGLIVNIISTAILVALIVLCGIQYNFININFTKINSYQNLNDYQLSLCIIYIFCCVLGFIVFIKHLECKTMQKIYIIYGIISWSYSIVVCVICFLSCPKIIKNTNDLNCQSINLSGLLKDFYKFENIFYEINKYLCSDECPCTENEKMNFQKCPEEIKKTAFNQSLEIYARSDFSEEFNINKFMSYWEKIEKKFKCIGFCNISYYNLEENNLTNINKFLFSDNRNNIIYNGCIFSLSNWLNKMILSFNSLLIINIVLSAFCIYICFAILFDKVYEGSNYPEQPRRNVHKKKNLGLSENKQININNDDFSKKDKSIEVKITNDK